MRCDDLLAQLGRVGLAARCAFANPACSGFLIVDEDINRLGASALNIRNLTQRRGFEDAGDDGLRQFGTNQIAAIGVDVRGHRLDLDAFAGFLEAIGLAIGHVGAESIAVLGVQFCIDALCVVSAGTVHRRFQLGLLCLQVSHLGGDVRSHAVVLFFGHNVLGCRRLQAVDFGTQFNEGRVDLLNQPFDFLNIRHLLSPLLSGFR